MPVSNNPFIKVSPLAPPRPYLRVILNNPHAGKRIPTYGLIDTGADECALPASFAIALGHNFTQGKKKYVNGVGGSVIAYSHAMIIEIPGFVTKEVEIDFVDNFDTPLLGVKNFLSNFILTVDYKKKVFSLKTF